MMQKYWKQGILLLAVLCLLLTACGKDKPVSGSEPVNEETFQKPDETLDTEPLETEAAPMPWEVPGAKQPGEYTWEEYEALTTEQRKAFRKYLGTAGFQAWMEQTEAENYPWELPNAKQPEDYTWDEFEALTEEQKQAFMECLGPQGLESWLSKVQGQNVEYPWNAAGAKQPKDYTWAEYQALTSEQKAAFAQHLGASGYQKWLQKVQGSKNPNPWDKPGAKHPRDYTWEEYEALTVAQRKAFRDFLGTYGYEVWLERALKEKNPWEEPGAKQPGDYTWEEYKALTDSQKVAFQEKLGANGFEAWLKKALQEENENANPWELPGGKKPQNYTWEEFEALTADQQIAFQNYLGTAGFEAWMEKVQKGETNPWEEPGAKQPKDYTWEEFEALTADQQIAFQNYLGTAGFEAWLEKAQGAADANPWEEPGAKQPGDYTWAEFEALTAEQQMAFQNYLGEAGFEAWLKKAQSPGNNPWEEPGAKQPGDYTWAEFEALTAEQQMAFQEYLGEAGFEAWMKKAQSAGNNPWEQPGAKQPADYTWAEFEALTGAQQIAFQNYLGEAGFEAWLEKAQGNTEVNPWDEPGAKPPEDYTWEEFEALTGAQQIAFQEYLGEVAFEAWLNRVLGL